MAASAEDHAFMDLMADVGHRECGMPLSTELKGKTAEKRRTRQFPPETGKSFRFPTPASSTA